MKKFALLSLILAGVIMLGVTSCGDTSGDPKETGSDTNAAAASGFDYSAGLTDEGFFKGVKATDYVTLPQYKGVAAPADLFVAAESDVQEQINGLLEKVKVTDRAVVDGDTLNIDYVGTVDGVEFEGGNTGGAGTEVTIGVTNYLEGFLPQLIGHMPGDVFDINVTFPEDYGKEELNGKDAVFNITINHILGADELTDAIAVEYGFDTKAALIADIEEWVLNTQKSEFFSSIISEVKLDKVPEEIFNYVMNSDLAYYEGYAAQYGVDIDTFMATYMSYDTKDAYVEAQTEAYNETATLYVIVQAIAELEGLSVSDEYITESGFEQYIETYGKPYLRLYLLQSEIVPAFVADNATVTE